MTLMFDPWLLRMMNFRNPEWSRLRTMSLRMAWSVDARSVIEQHGLHLPLVTDAAQGLEIAKRAAERAKVLYTPVLWFGYSPHHLGRVSSFLARSIRTSFSSYARI